MRILRGVTGTVTGTGRRWARALRCWALAGSCVLATACDRGTKPQQIGTAAPEFVVRDSQHAVDLAGLRGRVVVLNFWATWCAPCVEEIPSLEAMQRQLPDVVVLAVSTDDDSAAYERFLAEHHVTLLTVQDAAQQSNKLFGTARFPETYVIDKQGLVRRKFIGPQVWTSPEIEASLKKLTAG